MNEWLTFCTVLFLAIKEAMIIVKWGGVLTQAGRRQAITLGESFRRQVYGGK